MLVWLTQLGLSVAIPPAGFILLALWLRDSCHWGSWVIWAGAVLGLYGAVEGLRSSLKAMKIMSGDKKKDPPSCGFNEHD